MVVVVIVVVVVVLVGGATVVRSLVWFTVVDGGIVVVGMKSADAQGIGHCQPGPSPGWVTFSCKTYWKSLKDEVLVRFG